MALRTPLILISGAFSQLPPGDVVPGSDTIALASGNAALTLAATAAASGNSALVVANSALTSGTVALASGNAGLVLAQTALASGNSALTVASTASASGNAALTVAATALASGNSALILSSAALASGNAGLSSAATKLPLSGGVVSGQFAQNIVSLGLNGSGINCSLGNYFTAIISGATQVVVSGTPSSVSYSFTYEVRHDTGTITWFTGLEWPKGVAPTLTTGKTHLFMFVTDDAGSRWRGASLVDYTN